MGDRILTDTGLYLTFRLGDELFAVDVSQVREVLEIETITAVPNAPEFMRGIINVRGSVVPVVDLRTKFGMRATEETLDTRVVVMELDMDGEATVLGTLADSVHEVTELSAEAIEPPPRLGSRWSATYIKGVGKRDERFILLLNLDKVFSFEELTDLATSRVEGEQVAV